MMKGIRSEDEFIADVLVPLFISLGFEGVTALHHTGRTEYGKDIVFYARDALDGVTYYAVVACVGKIHSNSSHSRSSGHCDKILDQIKKCFELPYTDYNLKKGTCEGQLQCRREFFQNRGTDRFLEVP